MQTHASEGSTANIWTLPRILGILIDILDLCRFVRRKYTEITMLRICKFALILLAISPALHAQAILPKANVFVGYSYNHFSTNGFSDNLNGWEFSGEGQVFPFLGIVGDYSSHYGDNKLHEQNYLFGPRASVTVGKVRPFAELLIGGAHINVNPGTDTSFATAVGGGVDWHVGGPLAWRFQGDYLHTSFFGGAQNNVRLSTGIVFRF